MDIFGGWENYTERIEKNWNSVVGEDDCVVIPGDISWAMSIEEALPDFEFISRRLRGRKIISKGNHDYWWTTLKKMNGFLQTNGFDNIRILHNNAFEECGIAICGTRGWINDDGEPQDELVLLREAVPVLQDARSPASPAQAASPAMAAEKSFSLFPQRTACRITALENPKPSPCSMKKIWTWCSVL